MTQSVGQRRMDNSRGDTMVNGKGSSQVGNDWGVCVDSGCVEDSRVSDSWGVAADWADRGMDAVGADRWREEWDSSGDTGQSEDDLD